MESFREAHAIMQEAIDRARAVLTDDTDLHWMVFRIGDREAVIARYDRPVSGGEGSAA